MSTVLRSVFFVLAGLHLVPEGEQLSITKVDECGRKSTFSYKSNPAEDMMTDSECEKMKNFVGVHQTSKRLTSVLWLLSELALNQFGKGR